jgi:hypothetical protein
MKLVAKLKMGAFLITGGILNLFIMDIKSFIVQALALLVVIKINNYCFNYLCNALKESNTWSFKEHPIL